MEEALKDERFSHILTDPRFRKMPRGVRKVRVDKRFKAMFKSKQFKGKCMVDKRGRPLDILPSTDLKNLYDVSSESSASDEDDVSESKNETIKVIKQDMKKANKIDKKKKSFAEKQFSEDDEDSDGNEMGKINEKQDIKKAKKIDKKKKSFPEKLSSEDDEDSDGIRMKKINKKQDIKKAKKMDKKKKYFSEKQSNEDEDEDSDGDGMGKINEKQDIKKAKKIDKKKKSFSEKQSNEDDEDEDSDGDGMRKINKKQDMKKAKKIDKKKKFFPEKQSSEDDEDSDGIRMKKINKKQDIKKAKKIDKKSFPEKQSGEDDEDEDSDGDGMGKINKKQDIKKAKKIDKKKKSFPVKQPSEDDEIGKGKIKECKQDIKKANKIQKKGKSFPKQSREDDDETGSENERIQHHQNIKKVNKKERKSFPEKQSYKDGQSKKHHLSNLDDSKMLHKNKLIYEKGESSESDSEEDFFKEKVQLKNLSSKSLVKQDLVTESDSENSEFDTNELSENVISKSHVKKHLQQEKNESSWKRSTSDSQPSEKDSSEESDDDDDEEEEEDSESDDDSEDKKEEFDHQWEELQNEAPDADEITRRFAVCNMDWDRITAKDLLVAFNSFKPADGIVHSVKIYPSEYGLKRMEEERIRGPPELVEETLPLDANEPKDPKGSKYHREKLRQYQINRLKYYYAVVECDSPETTNVLYEQMNGKEYESSSVRFDLRIIPDDVTFDHEPTDVADKVPDSSEYKPRLFVTSALQQVKVDLTWDETDPKRREILQKAFTAPEEFEEHLQDYLASPSSDSEEEIEQSTDEPKKISKAREAKIAMYRELIHSIDEKEKMKKPFDWDTWDPDLGESVQSKEEPDKKLETTEDEFAKYRAVVLSHEEKEKQKEEKFDAEITWVPGLKQKTEELVKKRMGKDTLTPFEEMLQKKKEKKLRKKRQKSMDMQTDNDSDSEGNTDSVGSSKDTKQLAELALLSNSRKDTFFEEKCSIKKEKAPNVDHFKVESASGSNSKNKRRFDKKWSKQKKEKMNDFEVDVNDSRFSAIYTSHLYNIDPSDPHYKDTEGNRAFIQEKQRRLKSKNCYGNGTNKRRKYC